MQSVRISEHSNSDEVGFILTACCASQLGLICPLRDEEMLPERFGADAAVSVHQPPPQDGGTHEPSQFEAEVRS